MEGNSFNGSEECIDGRENYDNFGFHYSSVEYRIYPQKTSLEQKEEQELEMEWNVLLEKIESQSNKADFKSENFQTVTLKWLLQNLTLIFKKILNQVSKGVPDSIRGRVWLTLSNSAALSKKYPADYFETLTKVFPLQILVKLKFKIFKRREMIRLSLVIKLLWI